MPHTLAGPGPLPSAPWSELIPLGSDQTPRISQFLLRELGALGPPKIGDGSGRESGVRESGAARKPPGSPPGSRALPWVAPTWRRGTPCIS